MNLLLLASITYDITNPVDEITEKAGQTVSWIEQWTDSAVNWFLNIIPNLVIAIVVFFVGWWLAKLVVSIVRRTMKKGKADDTAISFICSFLTCTLRIIVIISALSQLGVNVTALLTAIGAATVTVGLALQDTMGNIASGILIIINKPFKAGDYLEFEGVCGTVTKIKITNTYLNTVDNKEIVIPNKRLTANNVINYSSNEARRVDLQFQISYDDDIKTAKKLIKDLILEQELILKDREPVIGVISYNDSSISIDVKVWCKTDDYWTVYYSMEEQVKYLFDRHGISIPYPQVVIHEEKN